MSDYQLLAIEASALRINIVRELKFVYEVSNLWLFPFMSLPLICQKGPTHSFLYLTDIYTDIIHEPLK